MMTADNDLIRRQDALAAIHAEMKRRAYTASRKQGYKDSIVVLRKLPSVQPAVVVHAHWFVASGWWLCSNCGGRSSDSRSTPYCPWCGARMDEFLDREIE